MKNVLNFALSEGKTILGRQIIKLQKLFTSKRKEMGKWKH